MYSIEGLIGKIKAKNPRADTDLVRLAFEFAEKAHAGQKRASGEPYITHPIKTAEILVDMNVPMNMVIAGLLHDVPEDTTTTINEIQKNFGDDITSIVSGITKLGKLKYRGIERYMENLRKMFVAMAQDVRVVIVKFADRIHNLETLDVLPPEKRRRVALESLEIYAPIANRLGFGEIKTRIEDLAFKHVYPKEYAWVKKLSDNTITIKRGYINAVKKLTSEELIKNKISFNEIQGRVKHLYSLYNKLLKYDREIVHINDLIALRIIVPTVADCYATLGIIHQKWKPLKGRIKDYIAQPKPNGYQSLHTTVFCEKGETVEFQIRTIAMHEEAENGIAAHWQYDEDGKTSPINTPRLAWVKELAEKHKEFTDPNSVTDALENLKIEVFQNRIFVFTPQGDVIDLPEGASAIDFAYAIHTDVGNTATGARINDHMMSLTTTLASGDCCEIIRDKNRKSPNTDWLEFVKTHHARSVIRSITKSKMAKWIDDRTPENEKSEREEKKGKISSKKNMKKQKKSSSK